MPGKYSRWVPKCKYCGAVDKIKICEVNRQYPPMDDPEPSTFFSMTCRESPTGRHKLVWVRVD